ncbi:hypothetical protein ACFE04_022678 [Oxalis oulophora]
MAADKSTLKTLVRVSLAGTVVAGPLVCLSGLSFLATMTLLLITSPLLLIFSPLLVGAALLVSVVLVGFGAALGMAVVGGCALLTIVSQVRGQGGRGGGVVLERLKEDGGVTDDDIDKKDI